ncbi:MAG: beta-lactamase family protein [Oscillospiraceae bacterium]|nr:beta-lactamase family protein [Oscillospiraceae bacterium]
MNFKKLTKYLDSFYAEKNIPGVGFKMYYRNKPVFEHYTGYADAENKIAFGADTLFNLYSATKVITCTAAMQLIETGKIKLDAPLHEYIPEYKNMFVRHEKDGAEEIREAKNTITIENLFTMTGGISGRRDSEKVRQSVKDSNGKAPTLKIIKAMAGEPLLFEPGTRFKYGYCHDVLGGVIEAASGKRLGEYMKENIFDRIGMADTTFSVLPANQSRMAKHYIGFDSGTGTSKGIGELYDVHAWDEFESGGGGLVSSVNDYILFAAALCNYGEAENGERILLKQSVDNMRTNRLQGVLLDDFAEFGGWSKAGYGYGLGVRTLLDRERNNSLSENGEFGWDGACGCYVLVDPAAEVALFYAQQEAGSKWWEWHGTVRNFAYAGLNIE